MNTLENLKTLIPINLVSLNLTENIRTGVVVVDEVNGFCTPGCGPLAPPVEDARINQMVDETVKLTQFALRNGMPVLAFRDSHTERPEPPYPPHCIQGSGDDEIVEKLSFLNEDATIVSKDCINGFVGSIQNGRNLFVDWVNRNEIERIIVVGICTDICVMDFVLTTLSARNHELMPTLKDVVVYEPGCATYNLPLEVATSIGLPPTAAHPREETHYMGLYFMASRGAVLCDKLTLV